MGMTRNNTSYLRYDEVCFALIIMTFAADREVSITVTDIAGNLDKGSNYN